MADSIKYDQAKDHFSAPSYPGLPIEDAFLHIGMFLGWAIENDMMSELFEDESGIQMIRFQQRTTTSTILSETRDGYLGSEQFEDEYHEYLSLYYLSGQYITDYKNIFSEFSTIYHVEDTWDNYYRMEKVLSARFKSWKNGSPDW